MLVVLPTYTWQAYNFRDDDHDGRGDTWYAGSDIDHVRLDRPFLARGVPPHFVTYDLPFLQWLEKTGKQADFVSDTDLGAVYGPQTLHRAYALIVFPGTPRVRDPPRVRHRHRVPGPRRAPDVPERERLLLAALPEGQRHHAHLPVASTSESPSRR